MQPLIDAINNRQAMLFVGAGVSMNVELPSWEALIGNIAERVGHDPKEFSRLGDYRALAEYYILSAGSIGKLRSWMDVEWHFADKRQAVTESPIYRAIVELNFPVIYTTNYDRYLEWGLEAHGRKFVKIINGADLVAVPNDAVQVVKFHGDFDDDDSIVLTESSYFERLDFESPLDIKLQSDLLGKAILFIGYSLTDVNMRYLIYRLNKMWTASAYANVRPTSYMFLVEANPVQEAILKSRGIIPIVSREPDFGEGLRRFLTELQAATRSRPVKPPSEAAFKPAAHLRRPARKALATRCRSPGSISPPSRMPLSSRSITSVGELKARVDRVSGSIYQTSSTPASKYSRSFRSISGLVLLSDNTSTARLWRWPESASAFRDLAAPRR